MKNIEISLRGLKHSPAAAAQRKRYICVRVVYTSPLGIGETARDALCFPLAYNAKRYEIYSG